MRPPAQGVMMQNRIVVPLDGSAFGKRALPFVLALARRSDATVEIAHVHERPPEISEAPALETRLFSEQRTAMRDDLMQLARQLRAETGISASAQFLDGDVVPALRQHLSRTPACLVVMMTHGRGGQSSHRLGSVAEGLVRVSPVPILLLRVGSEWPGNLQEPLFRRVLVPLDGSANALEVLPYAMWIAQPGQTAIELLSVADPALPATSRLTIAHRLDELATEIRVNGVDVTTTVIAKQHPAQAILAFAEERGIDLIALVTHGRGALGRLLPGTTAEEVIRAAQVPMLVYRVEERGGPSLLAGHEARATHAMD